MIEQAQGTIEANTTEATTSITKPSRVIIPMAGKGTRMRPLTYDAAKHNTPLGGAQPIIYHTLREAHNAGMEEIILVTNPHEVKQADGTTELMDYSDPAIMGSFVENILDAIKGKFADNPHIKENAELLLSIAGLNEGIDIENYDDLFNAVFPHMDEAIVSVLTNMKQTVNQMTEGNDEEIQAKKEAQKRYESALEQQLRPVLLEKLSEKIKSIPQKDPRGLGDAIYRGKQFIPEGEPFAVMLPDDVMVNGRSENVLAQMAHDHQGGCTIASLEIPQEKASAYGCFITDPQQQVAEDQKLIPTQGLIEKPANPPFSLNAQGEKVTQSIMGRYILDYSVMEELTAAVAEDKRGAGDEIQLTDAIVSANTKGTAINAYKYDGHRYDIGRANSYADAVVAEALQMAIENKQPFSERTNQLIEEYTQMKAKEQQKAALAEKVNQSFAAKYAGKGEGMIIG